MNLHKSVTVSILKKFNAQELNELSAFINFSVGEKNDSLKNAFAFLKSCAPDYDSKFCTKENFSKKVFNKKLNYKLDKEINRLMSELKDELEKYMAYQYAIKNNIFYYTGQFAWYHVNGMTEQEAKILDAMEGDILNNKSDDIRELYRHYLEHKLLHVLSLKDHVSSFLLFQHYANFLINKNEITLNTVLIGVENVKQILSGSSEKGLRKKKSIPFYKSDFINEASFYRAQLQFVKQPNVETYLFLKEQLLKDKLSISGDDKDRVLTLLNNNLSVVAPTLNINKEALDLTEMIYEIEKSKRNGNILYSDAYQYIFALIETGKTDSVKKVMKENRTKITGITDKENFFAMVEAMILEKEKKFEESLQIINTCHNELPRQKRDIILMKVRLAYELKQSSLFNSYINNLRKYLSDKNTVNATVPLVINYMLAFASYLSRLFKLQQFEKEKLTLLKQKALNDKRLYRKSYILEKIEEKLRSKN